MRRHRILAISLLASALSLTHAQVRADATLGAIVGPVTQGGFNYLIGGASGLVLDEPRGRLYLFNTGQRRREIYSLTQRRRRRQLAPNLGGVCVTINTTMLPLSLTSATQINAQLPPDLAPGRYPVVVRNLELKTSSNAAKITVAKHAPAGLAEATTKQKSIYYDDGSLVTRDNPAQRDDRLHLFVLGLGPVKGPRLVAGQPTSDNPPGNTDPVKVFFGDPGIQESEMDVEESYLMPGLVGVYRIPVYVPWYRRRGTDLLVTVRIGNVDSPSKGTAVPTVAVE